MNRHRSNWSAMGPGFTSSSHQDKRHAALKAKIKDMLELEGKNEIITLIREILQEEQEIVED